jgi:hypothetical protein
MQFGRHRGGLMKIKLALTPIPQPWKADSLDILWDIPYIRELTALF